MQSEYEAAQPDKDIGYQWKQCGVDLTQWQYGEAKQPAAEADQACYGGRGVRVLCNDGIHLRVVVDLTNQYSGRIPSASWTPFFIQAYDHCLPVGSTTPI